MSRYQTINNLLSPEEVAAVISFMKDNYSKKIFREINMALDAGEIDLSANSDHVEDGVDNIANITSIIQSKPTFDRMNQDLEALDFCRHRKQLAVTVLAEKYIEKFVLGFSFVKGAPSVSIICELVEADLTINSNFEVPPPVFTGNDKKLILENMHNEFSQTLLNIIAKMKLASLPLSFESAYKASPVLRDYYDSLNGFDYIPFYGDKKEAIQETMRSYIELIMLGAQFDEINIRFLLLKTKNTFGTEQFNKIIKTIQTSKSYPSTLELEGADDRLRNELRALDLYLHIPRQIYDKINFAQTVVYTIQEVTQNLKNLAATNNNNFSAKPTAAFNTSSQSTSKANVKAQSKPQTFPSSYAPGTPFSQFGNAFNQFRQDVRDFTELSDVYKKDCYERKDEMIKENRSSSNVLFKQIAFNKDISTINSTLKCLWNNGKYEKNGSPVRDGFGNTALHLAAMLGREDIVQSLLKCGYDADLQNDDGNLPLHVSFLGGNKNVVQALVPVTNDIMVENRDGLSVYMMGLRVCEKNSGLILPILQSHSFNVHRM